MPPVVRTRGVVDDAVLDHPNNTVVRVSVPGGLVLIAP
jgi:hypothetical protein